MATHEVRVERGPDQTTLVLSGEIDLNAAPEVAVQAAEIIAERPSTVLIDLSPATFLDSSGIGALVALTNAAEGLPVTIRMRPGPRNVMRVLDLVGLTEQFEMVDEGDSA